MPEPQLETQLYNKETGTPRKTYPTFELFKRCIDKQIIKRTNKEYPPFDVDEEKFKVEVADLKPAFQQEDTKEKEDISAVSVPDNFDWSREARRATRDAINIIYKSGIADRDTIVAASRSTGPGNTVVIEGQNYAFHNAHDWLTYLYDKKSDLQGGIPIPENKKLRDQYIKLEIGTDIVKSSATWYLRIAQELGLELTPEQALRLDLVREAGHEYAHGIDSVVSEKGEKMHEKARRLGFIDLGDFPEGYYRKIGGEYFARGFERVVFQRYLIEEYGCTQEQVKVFVKKIDEAIRPRLDAAFEFINYAKQAGYSSKDIDEIESAILARARESIDRQFGLRLEGIDIQNTLAYDETPYSEEQLSVLCKT